MTVRFPAFAAAWSGDVCGGGGASSYNPLTDWTTPPVHAMWAADPLWTPPADGGAVSSWRNGGSVGTPDFTQGTAAARPTYDASNAAFGGQPSVNFDGTDDVLAMDPADIAQPFWLVAVAKSDAATSQGIIGIGANIFSRLGITSASGGLWALSAGTGTSGGASDTDPHLFLGKLSGASSDVAVDGSAIYTADAGTGSLTLLSLGAGNSSTTVFGNFLNGDIAYAAVFTSDPTAQPEWADFVDYCENTVGLTIA